MFRVSLSAWGDRILSAKCVTEVLDGGARLGLSEAGARVIAGAEAIPLLGHEPTAVEREIARLILGQLAGRGGAGPRPRAGAGRSSMSACSQRAGG